MVHKGAVCVSSGRDSPAGQIDLPALEAALPVPSPDGRI